MNDVVHIEPIFSDVCNYFASSSASFAALNVFLSILTACLKCEAELAFQLAPAT